jgi:YVTN family beta-propeller protein
MSHRFAGLLLAFVALATTSLDAQEAWVSNANAGSISVVDCVTTSVVQTFPVGAQPARITFSSDGSRAYVPLTGADALAEVDAGSRSVLRTIATVDAPNAVVLVPGSRAYVAGANGIVGIVDLAASAPSGTIVLGSPAAGYSVAGLALSPDGSKAYATWGNLFELDTATDTITRSVFAGVSPAALALTHDGTKAYVSATFGYPSFSFYGSVVAVDVASFTVSGSVFTWALPAQITLNRAGTEAHVSTPSTFVDTGYGAGFLPSPWVSRLDLVAGGLDGGTNAGASAGGHALSRDETRLFVAVAALDALKVIDRATNLVVATVPVGDGPTQVALRPSLAASAAGKTGRNESGVRRP